MTNQCSYAYGHADLDRCTHISTYLRGRLDYVREQFESREKKTHMKNPRAKGKYYYE